MFKVDTFGYSEENNGDRILVKLSLDSLEKFEEIRNSNTLSFQKDIIICLDCSDSMSEVMALIKESLIAFRNVLLCDNDINKDSIMKELEFREMINLQIITFNNKATKLWDNLHSKDSFETAVDSITTEGTSNLESGIEETLNQLTSKFIHYWIILITDGDVNAGNCRTINSFKGLLSNMTDNSKLISLGFGDQVNIELLTSIGDFIHIDNKDSIPWIVGGLAKNILTSRIFKISVSFKSNLIDSEELNDDDLIFEKNNLPSGELLIGDYNIFNLSSSYDIILLYQPYGEISDRNLLHSFSVNITFTEPKSLKECIIQYPINLTDKPNFLSDISILEDKRKYYMLIYKALLDDNIPEILNIIGNIDESMTDLYFFSQHLKTEAELGYISEKYLYESYKSKYFYNILSNLTLTDPFIQINSDMI